jgi:hypothetical protein
MKRTYKKKSNLINKTGYTPGYDTEKNPVNYIPSEDITMANTPYPLYATPLDENGNPIGNGMMVKPGGEYKFPGAAYVAETPMFKKGGEKRDWISAKISKLVREEGYPQKQAVAMAYEMYDNMHKNGGYQLPMYQTAGYSFTNNFPGSNFPKPMFTQDPNIATPEQFSEQMNKITEVNPSKYGLGQDPNYVNPLSDESLTAGQDFRKRADEMDKAAGLPQDFSKNIFGETTTEDKSKLAPPDVKGEQPFQFFNPYSGFDIPTAASTLGSSIESGDTLGTIGSGLKLATGLARNFFGGMGQEKRKNYVTQQSYEKQREGMTGAGREVMAKFGGYYQEGGMQPGMEQQGGSQEEQIMQQVAQALQQGMSPEEVMQQLIQMGMSEEQAVGLIQSLMQQMQPSTPQLKRGGMMYYQDGGEEDEYGYEDEEEPNYMINKPSLMGKQQNFSEPALATSPAIESAVETTSSTKEEEETPSYDKNSARDTWVAKTGMPWSEAKRLGYTSGSAKDNMKLLSELNDPRFKKEYLRGKPLSPAKKQITKATTTKTKPTSIYEYFGTNKESLQKKGEAYRKANQIQTPKEGNFITRTGEILANPLQSLSHYSKYKELPAEGFSKNNKNAHDQVIGMLNPMYWANALSNAVDYAGEGEYKKAALESLDAAPALGKIKYVKNIPFPKGLPPASVRRAGYLEQGAKRLGMEEGGYYQYGGDYDTYNEKDFKDNDIVRHSGGNTGLTKSELNSLAKQYKMSPQEFLNIISYGEPGEGMSSKYELSVKGSDKYLPKNWRETYKQNKTSTTGFRGALNKGLDYIGVDPIFNMGGYYQDGGEQQVAQQVAQAMQQGMQPQEAMAMLVESGMTEDQAMQLVQAIIQQIQQQPETPQLRKGGEMIKRADGSYSRRGLWDNIRDNRGSGKAPTREMLEQEAKIKREYQEGGMEPGADPAEAMMQQISQMLQQGAEPEQIMQMLIEAGVPEDQAMQMVQAVMEQIQEPQGTPQMRRGGGYYQEGGEEMDEQMEGEDEGAEGESPNMEQIEDQVEQALQQGADPQQVLQQLVEMGIPEEQAMQMIQEILQEIQGGETDMEEPEEGTPQMSKGGKYMRALVGKTIKNYTYNPKTDSYIVSYE